MKEIKICEKPPYENFDGGLIIVVEMDKIELGECLIFQGIWGLQFDESMQLVAVENKE